jgi:hypothetical protein
MRGRQRRRSGGTMRKRPRVSLSLIVAETVRSGPTSRTEPPVLHLVSPTGGELDVECCRRGPPEAPDFVLGRIGHGLDTLQQFTRCRDWFDIFSVQQSWVQRTQADYASACALLTAAALRMVAGAATYPEPPPRAA